MGTVLDLGAMDELQSVLHSDSSLVSNSGGWKCDGTGMTGLRAGMEGRTVDYDRGDLAWGLARLSLCPHQVTLPMSGPILGLGPCQ